MGSVSNLAEAREARRLQDPPKHGGKGYALLHRKIMDLPFYKDAESSHLWVHLLLRANYQSTLVTTEIGDVLCDRGEFITGRNTLAIETGLDSNRVQYLIRKFEKMGMITTKSNRKFTVIRVVKYDEYQQISLPTDYQQNTKATPHHERLDEQSLPADYHQITTDKELNNNLLPKGNKYVADDENQNDKETKKGKPKLSCEEVWQCLKEELPEARGWRILDEDRRNLIRRFWAKANKIARQMDGQPMTMQGFREYLQYIRANCRWMLEDRPDDRTGKTWRKKKFDNFLSEKLYRDVREGDKDDR